MKKYSDDYFEKKYKILFDKLMQKEGFVDDIKATRKELGLPIDGFANGPELADFFISKLGKAEKRKLTMWAFLRAYEYEQKRFLTEDDKDAFTKAFMKKHKKDDGIGMLAMMVELGYTIETHHNLFTKYPFFEGNKYLSKLYKSVFKLMQKYWGLLRTSMTKSIKSYRTKCNYLKLKCLNTVKQITNTKILLLQ